MAKDLLKLQRAPELNLRTLLRPAVFVPESKGLNELLRDFRSNRNHLAIVIDEFGSTAGLITIEDVLEEIVGEIEDEFDDKDGESGIYTLADGSQRVAGDAAIDAVNEAFGIRAARGRLRHHRRPGRARTRPRAAARRGGRGRRAAVHGDAHARRRGALVQGDARARGSRRAEVRAAPDLSSRSAGWPPDLLAGRSAGRAADRAPSCTPQLWWLQLACVGAAGLALVRTAAPGPRRPCWAWLFGTAWLAAGIWWLFISMHHYGGLPAWLAVLAAGAARAWRCRSYLGRGAGRCSPRLRRGTRCATRCCLPRCGCWPSWRAACSSPAFPGSRRLRPCRRPAGRAGRPGSASTASARWRPRWPRLAAAWRPSGPGRRGAGRAALPLAMLAGRLRWPAAPTSPSPTGRLRVTLLQGNVPQDEKFSSAHLPRGAGLDAPGSWHGARGDLVVAPETAIPLLPEQLPEPGTGTAVTARTSRRRRPGGAGRHAAGRRRTSGYTNSAARPSPPTAAAAYRYDKHAPGALRRVHPARLPLVHRA